MPLSGLCRAGDLAAQRGRCTGLLQVAAGAIPSVLGSRQPVIRRADLGDKGTYYRAQIPFQNQSEASEFCSSLKAAGGQCVVQKN